MPETPEQKARKGIDAKLVAAGWLVQDKRRLNLHAGPGVALCETDVEGGFADYMLFVDAKAIGVLEAKSTTTPLVGVAEQSELYARAALKDFQRWHDPLPFTFESNGGETRFRNMRDPRSRSRIVFSVHRPETLRSWIEQPDIRELAQAMEGRQYHLAPAEVWNCYARLHANRVKSSDPGEALTNLISLVRFAAGQQADLAPFPDQARQRFQTWLQQQESAAHKPFTPEQRSFLTLIAEEIGANAALETEDLDHGTLKSRGGLPSALALFGKERLPTLLEELNTALAA